MEDLGSDLLLLLLFCGSQSCSAADPQGHIKCYYATGTQLSVISMQSQSTVYELVTAR